MSEPIKQRRVILGDTFRRIVRRGDWIWPHKNIAGTPGPHLVEADASSSASAEGADAAQEPVRL